jgi:hypothetical protein
VFTSTKPYAEIGLDFFPETDPPITTDMEVTLIQNTYVTLTLVFIQDAQLDKDSLLAQGFVDVAPRNGTLCTTLQHDPLTDDAIVCSNPVRASEIFSFGSGGRTTSLQLLYFPFRNVYSQSGAPPDSFSYYVVDALGQKSQPSTATVYVTHVNQPPVVVSQQISIWKTEAMPARFEADDADDAFESLKFVLLNLPSLGDLSDILPDGTIPPMSQSNNTYELPARNITVGNVTTLAPPQMAWIAALVVLPSQAGWCELSLCYSPIHGDRSERSRCRRPVDDRVRCRLFGAFSVSQCLVLKGDERSR